MFECYAERRRTSRQLGLTEKHWGIIDLVHAHHRPRQMCYGRRAHSLKQKMIDALIDDLIERGYLVESTEADIEEMKSYVAESRCPDMPSDGFPNIGDLDLTLLGKEICYHCLGYTRDSELCAGASFEQENGDSLILGTSRDAILREFHSYLMWQAPESAAIESFSDIAWTDRMWRDRWWRMFRGTAMMTVRCNPNTTRTVEDVFIEDESTETTWRRIAIPTPPADDQSEQP